MPVWIRAVVFLLIAPGTIAGWLPWYIAGASRDPWSASHGSWQIGALLTLAGWAVLLWCARDFALRGKGTPAPYDAPRTLVISGMYRFVRNPMYVAVLVAIIGQALWFRSTSVGWYALVVALGFHTFVVLYEEPTLTSLFGDAYREYCRRVPRWIPRRARRTHIA